MICTECRSKMILDDIDDNGIAKSKYYICLECQTSCIALYIGNKELNQQWHTENDNQVRDWKVINGKIKKR